MNWRVTILAVGLLGVVGSATVRAADGPLPGDYRAPGAGPVSDQHLRQVGWCPSCNGGHGGPLLSFGGGCKSCGGGGGKSCGGGACGTPLFGHGGHFGGIGNKHKEPFVVQLCPGACFGYFQTQWRRWDEVCPYPYQGMNVSDSPKPPTPYLASPSERMPPRKTSDSGVLPLPRPVDPKTGLPIEPPPGGGLPPIPMPGKQ